MMLTSQGYGVLRMENGMRLLRKLGGDVSMCTVVNEMGVYYTVLGGYFYCTPVLFK